MKILIESNTNEFENYLEAWNLDSEMLLDLIYNWVLQDDKYSNIRLAVDNDFTDSGELETNEQHVKEKIEDIAFSEFSSFQDNDPREFKDLLSSSNSFLSMLKELEGSFGKYAVQQRDAWDQQLESLDESIPKTVDCVKRKVTAKVLTPSEYNRRKRLTYQFKEEIGDTKYRIYSEPGKEQYTWEWYAVPY